MKKKNELIVPIIVFTVTLIIGLLAVLIAEQNQKARYTTSTRAYNYDDAICGTHKTTVEVNCGVADQGKQSCERTYHYLADPKEGCQVFDNPSNPTVACYTAGWEDGACGPCIPPPDEQKPTPETSPTPTLPILTNTPTVTPTVPVVSKTPTPTLPITSLTPTPTTPVLTNTPTPTRTPTPTNTPTPTITPTPAQNACGYTQCDDEHPCQGGLVCVTAKNDKSYCSKPELQDACKNNNGSYSACCSNPSVTVIAKAGPSNTPMPATPTIPDAGVTQWLFLAAPLVIITLGLLF